ncbi:MAG: GNAT family N-acetyltransferase [Gemmatimonadaceae bacterium]
MSTNLSRLEIIQAGPQRPEWDDFVSRDPVGTLCHLAAWQGVMKDVLGHQPLYLAAVDQAGSWRGVLPLVRVRTIVGHGLISLPFLNDGGPLGDEHAQAALVEHAVAEARGSGATSVELRSRVEVPGPVTPMNRKVTVLLELPSSVDELWKTTFRAKLRSQIRRPQKEGMTARTGSAEVGPFYSVFARNMRDLGTPVLPKAFFERLASDFVDHVVFCCVYTEGGEPAAAGCCLVWKNEMEITWASSLREMNRLSPNMLLYSHLMEAAIARGVATFNFGRCTPGSPTHRFKGQWGGVDVPLPWPTWSKDKSAVAVPAAERPLFQLASRMWQRLPMAVANRLGPPLARLLP